MSLFSVFVSWRTLFLDTVVPFSYLDTLNEEKQMLVHIIFFVLEHNLKCLLLLKGESEGTSYRF